MNGDNQATGNGQMSTLVRVEEKAGEWRTRLAVITAGLLAFTTVSGLAIWLLPFSVTNQVMVLGHTLAGIVFLVPCAWYLVRHLARYWRAPLSHILVLGYAGGAALVLCAVSGGVVTWQSLFGVRISYGWDLVHIITTLAIVAFVVPHLLVIVFLQRKARLAGGPPAVLQAAGHYGRVSAWVTAAGVAVVVLGAFAYTPLKLKNEFPADYSFKYGKNRPFAPSLATTESGGPMDPRLLSGSRSCGTSGCHTQIAEEWESSAHRYAAMDKAFQVIQTNMAKQNGPESTRYCGGCHDPISLFSGTKNLFIEEAKLTSLHGFQEGVSCLACHSLRKVDVKGNANFVIARPVRYMFELEYDEKQTGARRFVRDFLIRAYPRQHVKDLGKRMFKTPEYCASCHKQFVDQEINNVGWVQLQNQYDNWRQSRWNTAGNPRKTIECRECHMPLTDSRDPASGDPLDYNRKTADGKHRNHRFIGANQMMPAILKLPGWEKQVELTHKWLQGKQEIPEIADKWTRGAAVGIDLVAPPTARAGEQVPLKVVITSNKVGHDFPTGPLDIIQAWLQIEVVNERGEVVFNSAAVDPKGFITPGGFMFKAEPVDQNGNLIDRHNLWEMVGVRYRRSLFPGFSDTTEYSFVCPELGPARGGAPKVQNLAGNLTIPKAAEGTLKLRARLRYRKVDQFLLNFMFGENAGLTAPVTEMAEQERDIVIESVTKRPQRPRGTEQAADRLASSALTAANRR